MTVVKFMSAGRGISLRSASEQHRNHVSQVEATSAMRTAWKGNSDLRSGTLEPLEKCTVTQQHLWWCFEWWCFEWWCFVQTSAEEGLGLRVCISRCTGGGGTHRGPLPGRFLR